MDTPWRIELLGRLRATQGDRVVTRFRARKTGALLAYLAYYLERPHPREVLIELLWPEAEPHSGRSSLSRELTSLRRQLEPPGIPAGAVIIADRDSVQLNPAACATDVQAFETRLQLAARARGSAERITRLTEAVERYGGELLPGYFEEWILPERQRLAEMYLQAHLQLVKYQEQAGDLTSALQWAWRAVRAEPLCEELQCQLIRLLVATGQTEPALRQLREFERLLREDVSTEPGEEICALAASIAGARSQRVREVEDPPGPRPFESPAVDPPPAVVAPISVASNAPLLSFVPPSGTITFLLAELERPLRLADRVGEELAVALEAWREVLHPSFRDHHGLEIASGGNTLLMAFSRASDALAAAVAGQRGLTSFSWPGHQARCASGWRCTPVRSHPKRKVVPARRPRRRASICGGRSPHSLIQCASIPGECCELLAAARSSSQNRAPSCFRASPIVPFNSSTWVSIASVMRAGQSGSFRRTTRTWSSASFHP
jgi:DNA-binding SARP family transcriptional activator